MWKIFLLLTLLSTNLFAQNGQDQFHKQLEEIMKAREEMLRALMDDSMSGSFEKRMMDIMKNFENEGDFGFGQMEGPVVGEYDWVETDTHKILKIKVKQIKDKPLDIKIQNNEIKIKGDVESTQVNGKNKIVKRVNFERTFEMPDDIDKTNPEFENSKDGFMQIKFKKLVAKASPKKESIKKSVGPRLDDRAPIAPDSGDLSI